ncbi:MAG TPA: hypothetical protein VFW68_14540 [Rhodocyclaceae bacterium]|nr:hypothetical protein [Rhodocyclaceae bacterium]
MNRRHLLRLIAAAGLAPAFIRQALANGSKPVQPGLRKVTGTVLINGQAAAEGSLVKPGDVISTGAGSQAIYVIGQDAFLQRASTEVHFPMNGSAFFRLVSGRLLSVFGRGDKQLLTPTATIGIRGTACYLETDNTKSYFCLCYGAADLVPLAAPQERTTIRTQHHDHPIYIHADPHMPTSMVPAEVINHTDAELELLEGLVGRVPPFVGRNDRRY